jgi:hypothetical protein
VIPALDVDPVHISFGSGAPRAFDNFLRVHRDALKPE